jgi:S-adenosylmethionine:tRNA ribosyltransferase-isomerase
MKAARVRRTLSETVKMMVVRNERIEHSSITQLGAYLTAGDVVVVNDAATLPASLTGHLVDGSALEIRLLSQIGEGLWQVVAFGEGNWLIPTEDRQPPVPLHQGEEIIFSDGFSAEVMEISARSERLLTIRFKVPRENFWRGLYRTGRPVQYSYMSRGLELWSVQNVYSSRPWAIEMPSAGHAFTWDLMLALMGKGVRVVGLTHAAGISSTGDERIDQELPLRERFEIPAGTIAAIENAKANGHRIIAIGTSVVRALESYAIGLTETTDLKIGSGFKLRLVDGLTDGNTRRERKPLSVAECISPLRDASTGRIGI